MNFSSEIIGKIHQKLTKDITILDQKLIKEYSGKINGIDQHRYESFKKCLNQSQNIPSCYKSTEIYQLKPDLEKHSGLLEECLNRGLDKGSSW